MTHRTNALLQHQAASPRPSRGFKPANSKEMRQLLPLTPLTHLQISRLLAQMTGASKLMAALIYGTGMRLGELMQLRAQDIDFIRGEISIRSSVSANMRRVLLPQELELALKAHIKRCAVEKHLNAFELRSLKLFSPLHFGADPRLTLLSSLRRAAKSIGLNTKVSHHTLRISFANHLLQSGLDRDSLGVLFGL